MRHILIAGAGSYIGESFKEFLGQWPDEYEVTTLATKGLEPKPEMFEDIDAIFCVAGIAHIKETNENRHLYFDVNRDLVVRIAKAAKTAGVKQFILLSSMSVYGLEVGRITKDMEPKPITAYGESKLQADEEIKKLEDKNFIFSCLRPPMVYGKNCTGNYQALRKFALQSPIFPNYKNQRSMIYIGNLCEFVKGCIEEKKSGLFFPQNTEYTNTSEMVKSIAEAHGKKIRLTRVFNWVIKIAPMDVVKKVFGDLVYESVDTVGKYGLRESIKLTEK